MNAPNYENRAACRPGSGHDPELWFSETGTPHGDRVAARAKRICAGCPEIARCLDYALARKDHGVWGGLTAEERHQWRRNNRRAAS